MRTMTDAFLAACGWTCCGVPDDHRHQEMPTNPQGQAELAHGRDAVGRTLRGERRCRQHHEHALLAAT